MLSSVRYAARSGLVGRQLQAVPARNGGSIRVLLLDDVENRGSKGEIVSVKRGHARNLLIPRKRAAYVTDANLAKHGYVNKVAVQKSLEKEAKENEAKLVDFLKKPLVFSRAATPAGSLFGSVTSVDLKDFVNTRLKKVKNLAVEVEVPKAIKSVGEHSVKINSHIAVVLVNAL